jgi:hypothetical protein
VPPEFELPHAVIDPSALRAAKVCPFECGPDSGGASAPTDKGYIKIYSTAYSFAALKADGSMTVWGGSFTGGGNTSSVPTDKGYIKIHSRAAKAVSVE